METDSCTLPRVQGRGKARARMKGTLALAGLNPSHLHPPEPTFDFRNLEHACLGPATSSTRPLQDPFSATEKSKAVCTSLLVLWLDKTGSVSRASFM